MSGYLAYGFLDQAKPSAWAMHPFCGSKAHYWKRGMKTDDATGVTTICGHQTIETPQVGLLNPGNYPRCRHCARSAPKETSDAK